MIMLLLTLHLINLLFFFFNATAPTKIYTLSLHDALPILDRLPAVVHAGQVVVVGEHRGGERHPVTDRKSTRLNSSHQIISYAVFCLKKKTITVRQAIPLQCQ